MLNKKTKQNKKRTSPEIHARIISTELNYYRISLEVTRGDRKFLPSVFPITKKKDTRELEAPIYGDRLEY